jgi:AcrR family transcriptional regulator
LSTIAVGPGSDAAKATPAATRSCRPAKELFLRDGYEATTIRRIADVVGVSAPALYLYFKDKDAIMLALCDQTFARLIELMDGMESRRWRRSSACAAAAPPTSASRSSIRANTG